MRSLITTVLALTALTPVLSAQMLNESMDAEWVYSSFGSTIETHTVLVGNGVELPNTTILNDTKFEIDLGDDWIEFRFNAASSWSNTSFNGWLFRDAFGTVTPILGYSVDSFSAGITNTAAITTGFNDDECWANFAGMGVSGAGEWIRMKVDFGGVVLSVTNAVAGSSATINVDGTTNNGLVGLAYSLTGPGPTNTNTGPCGFMMVDLSAPIQVIGTFGAIGTTLNMNLSIPAGASGLSVWMQALDFGSCTLSNGVALTIL